MTQSTSAQHAACQAAPATIPAQRATDTPPGTGHRAAGPEELTGWPAVRRSLAIIRGLRSMATVPARPQPGYGESDGQ
ncbi:hypothetical protein [Kitasatospora sp. GAS204B]|uniref:hypothetical protein n=1 Tax=unclassified Kitasatospora TaxID=2633591 RepID=UPI00247486C5|nr:hypothetical protein [Kitasatospora sp. GAS204B]MDH6122054.1 hypothetical protein [Kitasatospora sp. GAS204B]